MIGRKTMPYFRCYTKIEKNTNFMPKIQPKPSESIVLVFDTETGSDQYQNLVFGSCGIWINGKLSEFFIFHNDELSKKDIEKLEKICQSFSCKVMSNPLKSCKVMSNSLKSCKVMSNSLKYCQVRSNSLKSCQVLSNPSK